MSRWVDWRVNKKEGDAGFHGRTGLAGAATSLIC